jgi:hypothetical protein
VHVAEGANTIASSAVSPTKKKNELSPAASPSVRPALGSNRATTSIFNACNGAHAPRFPKPIFDPAVGIGKSNDVLARIRPWRARSIDGGSVVSVGRKISGNARDAVALLADQFEHELFGTIGMREGADSPISLVEHRTRPLPLEQVAND